VTELGGEVSARRVCQSDLHLVSAKRGQRHSVARIRDLARHQTRSEMCEKSAACRTPVLPNLLTLDTCRPAPRASAGRMKLARYDSVGGGRRRSLSGSEKEGRGRGAARRAARGGGGTRRGTRNWSMPRRPLSGRVKLGLRACAGDRVCVSAKTKEGERAPQAHRDEGRRRWNSGKARPEPNSSSSNHIGLVALPDLEHE
jgi:hypothetical protein